MRFLVALMMAQNIRKFKFKLALYESLSVVMKDIAIGAGGSTPLRRCCFFWGGFETVLHRRRDGLPHLLHASA